MVKVTEYRQELRGRILEESMKQFKKLGIRGVKMDDIAKSLSISKRTLYEVYSDKEELLVACLKGEHEYYNDEYSKFMSGGDRGMIDILIYFVRAKMNQLADTKPNFLYDVSKYPKAVAYLRSNRDEQDSKSKVFFEQGVREGVFRQDVDFGLISSVGQAIMQYVADEQLYKQYTPQHLFKNIILLMMRGVCTPKGVSIIDQKLENL